MLVEEVRTHLAVATKEEAKVDVTLMQAASAAMDMWSPFQCTEFMLDRGRRSFVGIVLGLLLTTI